MYISLVKSPEKSVTTLLFVVGFALTEIIDLAFRHTPIY